MKLFSNYKSFWLFQNSGAIINTLNKIYKRKKAKCISTCDFLTLYTNLQHKKLLDVLF